MGSKRSWLVGLCGLTVVVMASAARAEAPATSGEGPPPGATRRKAGPADVRALTELIDREVAAKWAEAGVKPAPPADDAEFLRRVSLDLAGKIPTVAEARAFLDDPAADKREKLVEKLLDGPAYVTHFTRVWRSLLLPEADTDFQVRFLAFDFDAWLRKQVAANAGYDALARGVVAAPLATSGGQRQVNPYDRQGDPSPLAFYLAKEGKPENLAAGTARLFLGIRIECAQCHDHPFAKWTREQFWGYAAFFGGIQKTGNDDDGIGPIREVADRRELAIPGTDRVAQASFLDGSEPQWRFRVGSRVTLSEWMTSPENPYFARAGVNRVWSHFFGSGLVEPVDDLGEDHPPSHPELFDELARRFAAHGFDVKYLIRAITASRAYGLSSETPDPTPSDPGLLTHMAVKGLSPHQLYDSLSRATGQLEISRGRNPFQEEFNGPRAEFHQKFSRRDERPSETQTSILQALALMNGRFVANATDPKTGPLLGAVAGAPFLDAGARVETVFLAALGRKPRPEEAAKAVDYVRRGGASGNENTALADVLWALLNSAEFMFNH